MEKSGKKRALVAGPAPSTNACGTAKFEKCLKEISAHAFATSQMPVILSLECNTDTEGMEMIAEVLEKYLGGLLQPRCRSRSTRFLSPSALAGKVLVWADPQYGHAFSEPAMPESLLRLVSIELLRDTHGPTSGVRSGLTFAAGVAADTLEDLTNDSRVKTREMLAYTTNTLACVERSSDLFNSMYHGVQMCAVPAEAIGLERWLHETKFAGGCGFVQKPKWMVELDAKLPRDRTSQEKMHLRLEVHGFKAAKKGDWQVSAIVVNGARNAEHSTTILRGVKDVDIPGRQRQTWMVTVETLQLTTVVFTLTDHSASSGPSVEGWFGLPMAEIAEGADGGLLLTLNKDGCKKSKHQIRVAARWT